MSAKQLAQKLDALDLRVQKLEEMMCLKTKRTWKKAIGTAYGDALDQEASRLGAEWRAQENQRH